MQRTNGHCNLNLDNNCQIEFKLKDTQFQEALHEALERLRRIHNIRLPGGEKWQTFLSCFGVVKEVVNSVPGIDLPYVKEAWDVLSSIPKTFENHLVRNTHINDLVQQMTDVCQFMIEAERLPVLLITQRENMNRLFIQADACGRFLVKYLKSKAAIKYVTGSTADSHILNHRNSFRELLDMIQRSMAVEGTVKIHQTFEMLKDHCKDGVLDDLLYSKCVGHEGCIAGTRQESLDKILRWVDDHGASRVLFLSGQMGMGKTAMAHTIYATLREQDISSSLVCLDRKGYRSLFSTVAIDLAYKDTGWKDALILTLQATAIRRSHDPRTQFEEFILKPSKDMTKPAIIVIDGLDQILDRKMRKLLLDLLLNRSSELPKYMRLILTSRPEWDIVQYKEHGTSISWLRMSDLDRETVEKDIRRFIIGRVHGTIVTILDKEREDWVSALAKKSEGNFRWAELACDYIKPSVAKGRLIVALSQPLPLVYQMYHEFLAGQSDLREPDIFYDFKKVVHEIIYSGRSVFSISGLQQTMGPRVDVKNTLGPIYYLLIGIVEDEDNVRPFHTSLFDFFRSPEVQPGTVNQYYVARKSLLAWRTLFHGSQ